jgi:hypothetical protein
MASATFDAKHSIVFDLSGGSVHSKGAGEERLVLVPAAALDELVGLAGEQAGRAVGLLIGSACGRRIANRLGGPGRVCAASLDAVVFELNGELSLAGLGSVALERWGRAMVLVVEHPALSNDTMLASALEGALLAATGRDVTCAPLGRERGTARALVSTSAVALRVRSLVAQGIPWGEVLVRLQARGAPA